MELESPSGQSSGRRPGSLISYQQVSGQPEGSSPNAYRSR